MNAPKHQLKILHWNANSIRNKITELFEFLNENGTDVVCLNETFLKPEIKLKSNPKFTIYRFDRLENEKGGIAIIVRKRIKHKILPFINTKLIECMGIKIKLSDGGSIDIISAYLPGGSTNAHINQHYVNDINMLTHRNGCFFVCGDLNSKHRFCQQSQQSRNSPLRRTQQWKFSDKLSTKSNILSC
jgi:exonuclease III